MPNWINHKKQKAPKDRPFWAYLFQLGIRKMHWISAEKYAEIKRGEPEDFNDFYCEVDDIDEVWTPKWWCEINEIPLPK